MEAGCAAQVEHAPLAMSTTRPRHVHDTSPQVSPLFYWWLLRAAREYGPFDDAAAPRKRRLLGISLYTPRLNEIKYPQAHRNYQ